MSWTLELKRNRARKQVIYDIELANTMILPWTASKPANTVNKTETRVHSREPSLEMHVDASADKLNDNRPK